LSRAGECGRIISRVQQAPGDFRAALMAIEKAREVQERMSPSELGFIEGLGFHE
jgi:hypothetical protein